MADKVKHTTLLRHVILTFIISNNDDHRNIIIVRVVCIELNLHIFIFMKTKETK